jgi:hypothetical protein
MPPVLPRPLYLNLTLVANPVRGTAGNPVVDRLGVGMKTGYFQRRSVEGLRFTGPGWAPERVVDRAFLPWVWATISAGVSMTLMPPRREMNEMALTEY